MAIGYHFITSREKVSWFGGDECGPLHDSMGEVEIILRKMNYLKIRNGIISIFSTTSMVNHPSS